MSNNGAKKVKSTLPAGHVSMMAEQLRSKKAPDHAPLSSPGIEPLLPSDDLSMFFRNRAVTAVGFGGYRYVLARLLAFLLVVGAFIISYNYQPKFRGFVTSQSRHWLGVEIDQYIPKMGPRKKKKTTLERDIESADRSLRAGKTVSIDGKQVVLLHPTVALIREGAWREVDARLKGRCGMWTATSDCALKGYYLTYRGLAKSARPMLAIPDSQIAKLKASEKVLWYLTTSMMLGPADANHSKFLQALAFTPPTSYETKRILYDELIVSSAQARRASDLKFFLAKASQEPIANLWKSSLAKWNALERFTSQGALPPSMIDDFVKSDKGSLRSDLRSFELLYPSFIRAGRADKLLALTTASMSEVMLPKIDPTVTRRYLAIHIRTLWAIGRRAEALASLNSYISRGGQDSFSRHFQAAAVYNNGSADQATKALALLNGVTPNGPWETSFLKAQAMIRAGQGGRALPFVQAVTAGPKRPNQQIWPILLKAEYFVSQRRFADAVRQIKPIEANPSAPLLTYEILYNAYTGLGKVNEAGAVRLKIDDVKSKTGYSSSPEMQSSPLGPLALMP